LFCSYVSESAPSASCWWDDVEVHFINVHGENAHFVGVAVEKDETGLQQFCGTIILFARLQLVVGSSYL